MSSNTFPDAGAHFSHPRSPPLVPRDVAERGYPLPKACSEMTAKAGECVHTCQPQSPPGCFTQQIFTKGPPIPQAFHWKQITYLPKAQSRPSSPETEIPDRRSGKLSFRERTMSSILVSIVSWASQVPLC